MKEGWRLLPLAFFRRTPSFSTTNQQKKKKVWKYKNKSVVLQVQII